MEFEMLELLNLALSQVQQFPSSIVSSSEERQKGKYVPSPLCMFHHVGEMEDISFPSSFHGMLIFINSSLSTLCLT